VTETQLLARIHILRKLAWVSKWHRERLAEMEAEARRWKISI